MATSSKRAARPARTIRLLRPITPEAAGVVCVTAEDESAFYAVRELPCDIGGRGFAVHRLGLGTLYHVRVGKPHDCSCECKGFLYHGYCRHILGLLALTRQGKL